MNVYEAITKRRTIRKFKQEPIEADLLTKLIECARLSAYPANIQPLKFAIINSKSTTDKIFPLTKWAGYLADGTPKENERPTAYIAILGDKNIKSNGGFEVEAGAAVTSMMLEAFELGIGSCWLGAIDRNKIKEILSIDEHLDVVYLLALGYPMQESRSVEMQDGNHKYFESENGVINVPKRSIDEILITEL